MVIKAGKTARTAKRNARQLNLFPQLANFKPSPLSIFQQIGTLFAMLDDRAACKGGEIRFTAIEYQCAERGIRTPTRDLPSAVFKTAASAIPPFPRYLYTKRRTPRTEGPLRSGRRDSNSRPSPWQGDALPLSHFRVLMDQSTARLPDQSSRLKLVSSWLICR